MTAEKEEGYILQEEIIAELIVDGVVFHIHSNRIFHVSVPPFEKIGMKMINTGYQFLDDNGGGNFYNIFQFGSFSDIEPEVRDWAANPDGNKYTHADAIVIRNFAQKIMTDFYLRFNKPVKPTKIFYSLEKAHEWIKEQMKNE